MSAALILTARAEASNAAWEAFLADVPMRWLDERPGPAGEGEADRAPDRVETTIAPAEAAA